MDTVLTNIKEVSSLQLSLWTITLSCALAASVYNYSTKERRFWAKQGITGPSTIPYLGSLIDIMFKNRLEILMNDLKNHGKIHIKAQFGKIRLSIADPEIIRQITIKDFDAFQNHTVNEWTNKYQKLFLVWLKGDHWKQVRSLMSPTFTSGKIKRMFRFLSVCADDLLLNIEEQIQKKSDGLKEGAILNLMDIYALYTMDGISSCCYSLKLQRQKENTDFKSVVSRNDFLNEIVKILEVPFRRVACLIITPKPILRMVGFKLNATNRMANIHDKIEKMVKKRQENAGKFDDLLQLLVDANLDDELELNKFDEAENHHASLTKESLIQDQEKMVKTAKQFPRIKLSNEEVIAEAVFLMAAGMDTTRTLLSNCTYTLAYHPEIQEKLYQELRKIAEYDPDDKEKLNFPYESLTMCSYLDAIISETLRIIPPALATDRYAMRDYFIEKYNVTVPKGTQIILEIYSVQNNPEYWDEPQKFKPERFMPGNKEKIIPGSYMPFGMGPRHCIGMRFSLTEAKIGLAKVMMSYKFLPVEGLEFPPEPANKISLNNMKHPYVRLVRRN